MSFKVKFEDRTALTNGKQHVINLPLFNLESSGKLLSFAGAYNVSEGVSDKEK